MRSLRRLIKPIAVTTLIGVGGYYVYDRYKLNQQLQKVSNALKQQQVSTTIKQQQVSTTIKQPSSFSSVQIENLQSDIPALIQHEKQHHHTAHQTQDLNLQKEQSYQAKEQPKQLQNKQPQNKSQSSAQTSSKSQQHAQLPKQSQQHVQEAKQSEQTHVQPSSQVTKQTAQPQNISVSSQLSKQEPKLSQQSHQNHQQQVTKQQQKTQTNIVPQTPTSTNQQIPIKQSQPSSQSQLQTQPKQSQQQKQQKITTPINLTTLNKLSQLPHLPLNQSQTLKTAIVVADMGFTQQFQQKLLETIKSLKQIPKYQHIQIYRMNLTNQQNLNQIQKLYGHKIKQETIFLIKNQLDSSFVDINFDMYMQYPTLINTYLTSLNLYKKQNQKDYLKKLQKMGPNENYLMFVYDDQQPQEKRLKSLLAAKYIEMQLALHHLDHAVKVLPVEAQLAKQSGVIPESKIRSKSLHIIRKHNQFTHTQPNLHLKFGNQISPYHLLADIGFHNKRGQVAIQSYLAKIQTFNSLSITTPYILSVTVDKNRISTDNYKQIMDTFREIKRKNIYPEVGIALKFAQIGYLGKDYTENNEFCIKFANIAELQNQSSLHEMNNLEDVKSLGITQQSWLMNSNEYLYPHQVVSQHLINDFVQKALSGTIPQYYRSDKPSTIQNVHKIVASNFDQQILQNNLDHFVFQYSDHCPSCKLISPLIGYINQVLEPIPVQQRFDIHVMNSQKNRVKGQVYSPYTPNMSYFKNQWKHSGPVKIGLQAIKYQGLVGLYDFCVITKLLKTIDGQKFQQAINSAKGWNKAEFLL